MDDKTWIKNHQGVLYQRIKKNEREQGIKKQHNRLNSDQNIFLPNTNLVYII